MSKSKNGSLISIQFKEKRNFPTKPTPHNVIRLYPLISTTAVQMKKNQPLIYTMMRSIEIKDCFPTQK